MTVLRDYMIKKHIHHTFWCFNENSSDTGGLMYDNFQKWDDVKYEFVKPALWQTEDGKFVSLDHTIPLGKNGITLTEYYGGTVTPRPTETTTEPRPTETTAPKPTETTEPKPTETTAPKPTETTEPKPTETTAPKPTETTAPKPTETTAPKPTETTAPKDTEPAKEIVYGDVDGSGNVDILDVIVMNKFLLGVSELSEEKQKAADVDLDNKITPTDSLNILKFALEVIKKLPVK
jgi:Predicted solute binding protein